jgi:hypothetical protein
MLIVYRSMYVQQNILLTREKDEGESGEDLDGGGGEHGEVVVWTRWRSGRRSGWHGVDPTTVGKYDSGEFFCGEWISRPAPMWGKFPDPHPNSQFLGKNFP